MDNIDKKKKFSTKLYESTISKLNEISIKIGVKKSHIINTAVKEYLVKNYPNLK